MTTSQPRFLRTMFTARLFIPMLILFSGCAPTSYEVVSGLLEQGKNDEAIALSRSNLARSPRSPLLKYLGIALYNKKYYAEAEPWLDRSVSMDPEDDQAVYYLASCYEGVVDYPKAIQYYRRYQELTVFGEYRDIVEARVKILYRQQMDIEAKKALVEESQLDVAAILEHHRHLVF